VEAAFRYCPPFVAGRTMAAALRATGVSLGKASAFWGLPKLVGDGNFCSRLSIGSHTGFNVGCYFELYNDIRIGNNVAVGHDVMFLTQTYDTSQGACRATASGSLPVEVGDGAWLGARCTILPGVKIGAGSVIAASVVVSKDIPENVLFFGSRSVSLARWR